MDIPLVVIRFQLMLRIEDAHSKSERVYVFFPFNPNVVLGGLGGTPPSPWEDDRVGDSLQLAGTLRGAVPPLIVIQCQYQIDTCGERSLL